MVQNLMLLSSRVRRAVSRLLPLASFAVVASLALAGCAQGGRFAEGKGQSVRSYPTFEADAPQRALDTPERPDVQPVAGTPQPMPIAKAPPGSRKWQWIVVHHSATHDGGARRFDQQHRANGWDELGYHFVIGNGTDTKDGLVEIGPRWQKQKHGAHAKTPDNRFNDYGIGICLVGDFETGRPSPRQMKALTNLVAYLMQRYDIPAGRVIGHDDTGRETACPGRNLELQLAAIRSAAQQQVAATQPPQGQERQALYATEQR